MKKIVLSLAVLFSVAMVSCGGNKNAEATDSAAADTVVTEEVVAAANESETVVAAEAEVAEVPAESAK